VGFMMHFYNLLGYGYGLTVQSCLTEATNRADKYSSWTRHEYDDCATAISCLARYFKHEPDQIPCELECIAFDEFGMSGHASTEGLCKSKRICALLWAYNGNRSLRSAKRSR
jgi:hypothetical protein